MKHRRDIRLVGHHINRHQAAWLFLDPYDDDVWCVHKKAGDTVLALWKGVPGGITLPVCMGEKFYEYEIEWIDDLLTIMHDPRAWIRSLSGYDMQDHMRLVAEWLEQDDAWEPNDDPLPWEDAIMTRQRLTEIQHTCIVVTLLMICTFALGVIASSPLWFGWAVIAVLFGALMIMGMAMVSYTHELEQELRDCHER